MWHLLQRVSSSQLGRLVVLAFAFLAYNRIVVIISVATISTITFLCSNWFRFLSLENPKQEHDYFILSSLLITITINDAFIRLEGSCMAQTTEYNGSRSQRKVQLYEQPFPLPKL